MECTFKPVEIFTKLLLGFGNYILKIETKHGESYYKKLLIK